LVDNGSTAFSVQKNDDELSLVKQINKNIGNIWQYMEFRKIARFKWFVPSKQQGFPPTAPPPTVSPGLAATPTATRRNRFQLKQSGYV